MNLIDKNLLNELVVESREHLDSIEPDLLAMETNQNVPKETINRIFRAIHSIKGGFSFFGMENIKKLSHVMENVMMKMRDGELSISSAITDTLLAGIDKLRIMIDDLNASESINIQTEIERFSKLTQGTQEVASNSLQTAITEPVLTIDTIPVTVEKLASIAKQGQFLYIITVKANADLQDKNRSPIEFIRMLEQYGEFIDSWIDMSTITGLEDCMTNEVMFKVIYCSVLELDLLESAITIDRSQIRTFSKEEIRKKAGLQQHKAIGPKKAGTAAAGTSAAQQSGEKQAETSESIRVKVSLLNQLVNLAGELVLCRNQLVQRLGNTEETGIKSVLDNLDIVTSELQENIMSTRMQPLSSIFNKFPRLVRDLSHSLNKEAELVLQGESVELDKSIIEALTDPLTHLIRNSVDHGIEDPATRKNRGKPASGRVLLNAFHEGGQVVIEIRDDGSGINVKKVKEKAIAIGLMRKEDADRLTEKDAFNLILEPGFSTADKVTDVSGRGVGMDVVKTNIENLSGSVDITSEPLKGTTITLQLPLTLAIIPALTLECQGRRFAIPQTSLEELVHLHIKDASSKVVKINGNDVLRLRGKLLPLIHLSTLLGLKQEFIHPETKERMEDRRGGIADRRQNSIETIDNERRDSTADRRKSYASSYNIIVLKVGVNHYGLIVDKLIDTEEIVVKPLSSYLKNCKCYSGATIIGDGRVAMILDPGGIAELANLHFTEFAEEELRQVEMYKTKSMKEAQTLLLFRNGKAEYMALNLSLIRRIETTSHDNIEKIGNKEYLKYKDYSMRVIKPSDYLPISVSETGSSDVYIIVPKLVTHPIGILTDTILDVIETSAEIDTSNISAPGIQGSMIIDGKLILLLDIYSLFELADPENYKHYENDDTLSGKRILLVEDTSFFRMLEYNYLTTAGCIVDAVDNGLEAVEHLGQNSYDMVITDINMPGMNGFELTNHIRNTPALQHLPVVALTSMRDDKLEKECEEAGLDAYEIKIDKGNLLKKLGSLLQHELKGT